MRSPRSLVAFVTLALLGTSLAVAACGSAGGSNPDDALGGGQGSPQGTGTQQGAGGTSAIGTGGAAATGAGGATVAGAGGTHMSFGAGGTNGAGGGLALGTGGGAMGCASEVVDGQLVPLDMLVVLDRSGSMMDDNKWGNITGALTQFAGLPDTAGISMGLTLFGLPGSDNNVPMTCKNDAACGQFAPCTLLPGFPFGICDGGPQCDYTKYEDLVVPITALPGGASALSSAIAATQPGGGTPTTPALQGALNYALAWAQMNPSHVTMVVLATDGDPADCGDGNTVQAAAAFAAEGLTVSPIIKTFVIGVGSSLGSLNAIAQAGGTDKALLVDATSNAAQQFLDLMNMIRGSVACDFQIPKPSGQQMPDYSLVNVVFTPDGGMGSTLYNVGDLSGCGVDGGWYYDNPVTPTKIILCDATCAGIKQTGNGGKVDIELGCKTNIK